MNNNQEERRLKQQFQALRQEAERVAPSFNKVWHKALASHEDRQPSGRLPWFLLVGATTLASVALATWLYLGPLSPYEPFDENGLAWSKWQLPTDDLLESTGPNLFGNLSDNASPTDFLNTIQTRHTGNQRRSGDQHETQSDNNRYRFVRLVSGHIVGLGAAA
ncbi:MAG: hypothetical protein BMS9Abin36_1671 [Gammaproteobacteria bacterium]|nr:MAG: hypothetical protein BMS9Abin36_1671 [Gammaproteobacteria bacterium]